MVVSEWWSHVEATWQFAGWRRWLLSLAAIGRVITFDKRGVGLSEPVMPNALPTLEGWMDDVRVVMEAAKSSTAAVIGLGTGGCMAMMYAATHPDRVSHLVLVNAFARVRWADDYPMGARPEVAEASTRWCIDTWGGDGSALQFGMKALAPSIAEDRGTLDALAELQRLIASPRVAASLFRFADNLDVRSLLPSVQAPTLVIHRRRNRVWVFEHARYLASHIADAELVEVPGSDQLLFFGEVDAVVAPIQRFLAGARFHPPDNRVLTTILFVDIVNSTATAAVAGDRTWAETLEEFDRRSRRAIETSRGRYVKQTGDGLLATFDGPARAIRAALALRDSVRGLGIELRAGLHTGEVELRRDDITGVAVALASRIESLATPGEVLVSSSVPPLVIGSEIEFERRGEHVLKGIPGRWEVLAVVG